MDETNTQSEDRRTLADTAHSVPRIAPSGAHGPVTVVGGGLAGSEAAWQLARRGIPVTLVEMRPAASTPAHHGGDLGELVCSNSLKSDDPASAAGLLKRELAELGSIVLASARATSVPAGAALAVDRERFSATLTEAVASLPLVTVERREVTLIPEGPVIMATGPLTSAGLEPALKSWFGAENLAFYDAAAPIVAGESLDRSIVFAASRYDKGDGADYLNAPFERDEYEAFIAELLGAQRVLAKDFEKRELFSACQPIEEVARTGVDAVRFGALKPVGLTDPRTGRRPWAVAQLRSENAAGSAWNLVGFQTNLTFGEQERVFRMIPGLERAEFLRHGVMHRNTFIDAPQLIDGSLASRAETRIRVAGQLMGTEGYLEAAGTGLLAALNTVCWLSGFDPVILPATTALGSLVAYATDPGTTDYQPMHVNFGLVPPLDTPVRGKRERYAAYSARALHDLSEYLDQRPELGIGRDLCPPVIPATGQLLQAMGCDADV